MSKPVDITLVPECFGSFPVAVHKDEPQIGAGSNAALKLFERLVPEKDSRSHAVGPYGDAYAICYPEGDTEKTKLSAEIIEALWMYDGEFQFSMIVHVAQAFCRRYRSASS